MTSDSRRDGSWRRCRTRSAHRPIQLFPSFERFGRSDAAEAKGAPPFIFMSESQNEPDRRAYLAIKKPVMSDGCTSHWK